MRRLSPLAAQSQAALFRSEDVYSCEKWLNGPRKCCSGSRSAARTGDRNRALVAGLRSIFRAIGCPARRRISRGCGRTACGYTITPMTTQNTRRDILKGGLAVAGLGILGFPEWALPALAQGETLVPFTDLPATSAPPAADRRLLDVRTLDAPLTPRDSFFTTQHYGHPTVDPEAFRL